MNPTRPRFQAVLEPISTAQGMVLAGITLFAQFALVSITFPLSELFTENPLFHIDGAFHWYQMVLAKNLAITGNVVGFDPYFSAGHAGGITRNLSGRLPALLGILVPSMNEIVAYKLYVFASAVLGPAAIALAAWILRGSVISVIAASAFGILLWWVSYFHWYFTAGMVSFVTASYFAVLYIAMIVRYLGGSGGTGALLGLGLLGAVLFFCHPVFPVPVALATLLLLGLGYGRTDYKRLLLLMSVVPAISVLPNLLWLVPAYQLHGVDIYNILPHQKLVDPGLIWRELLGTLKGDAHGSKVYPAVLFAALWACMAAPEPSNRRLCLALVGLALIIEFFAYTAAAIPALGILQPNRLAPVGYLLLCVPAGIGLHAMIQAVRSGSGSRALRWVGAGSVVLVLAVGAVLTAELVQEVRPGPHGRYGAPPPEVKPLGSNTRWIMDWLQNHTTREGRVLFETSGGRVHDGAHMAGFYAYKTDREFIGTNYPYMGDNGFWDGWAFGKAVDTIPHAELRRYLELYNVGWILVHSSVSKSYFDRMPGVEIAADHGVFRFYRVQQKLTYFLEGEGRVEDRGHNRLVLNDVQGPAVVIKYHYIPGMRSDPPARIEAHRVGDDPNGFIRIQDPPRRLRLFLP